MAAVGVQRRFDLLLGSSVLSAVISLLTLSLSEFEVLGSRLGSIILSLFQVTDLFKDPHKFVARNLKSESF